MFRECDGWVARLSPGFSISIVSYFYFCADRCIFYFYCIVFLFPLRDCDGRVARLSPGFSKRRFSRYGVLYVYGCVLLAACICCSDETCFNYAVWSRR